MFAAIIGQAWATAAHGYSLQVSGADLIASCQWPSIRIDMPGPGSNGSMSFRLEDSASALSVAAGDSITFTDHDAGEVLFGGFVQSVTTTAWAAAGRTLTVRAVGQGALLDSLIVPVAFTPGAAGDAVGTAIQGIVGNFGRGLAAIGHAGSGIDSHLDQTVEVNAATAQVATMPTFEGVSLRSAINSIMGDAVSPSGSSSTSVETMTRLMPASADSLVALVSGANVGAGTDWHLSVGLDADITARSLLKFALDWTGVEAIESATLRLRTTAGHFDSPGASPRILIQRITADWAAGTYRTVYEGGTGWSASNSVVWPGPSTTTTNQVDTTITAALETWVDIDITALVEEWAPATVRRRDGTAGGAAANYGARLISYDEASSTRSCEFHSRDSGGYDDHGRPLKFTSYAPTLNLVYQQSVTVSNPGATTAAGTMMVYVDALGRLFCYSAAVSDGVAPWVVTTAPVESDEITASEVEVSDSAGGVLAVYVKGGNAASSGWVGSPAGPYAREGYLSEPGLTTAGGRNAVGAAYLASHADSSSVRVEVEGYDGWRPGQLVTITNPLLGAYPRSFHIAAVSTEFRSPTLRRHTLSLTSTTPSFAETVASRLPT